jgi:glycylpeptide N-tetradecanoyltransferase
VGVRATASGKLVAFISGIPIQLRIREKVLNCSEVNFLCVHKKLRSKRLAPVLIKEITRRCYVEGTFQAVYTVGSLLPTPVSTCRYFHRAIDWEKLYDVGFSPLPYGSTKTRQVIRYKLPDTTSTPGLREIEAKDVDATVDLLRRYLERMDMAQVFDKTEFEHWMCPKEKPKEQVVWSYVVEDPETKKITDYFSFYNLESTVIGNKKHDTIKAAYLFYYASETAFEDESKLKPRLNLLMKDALILSKKVCDDILLKRTNMLTCAGWLRRLQCTHPTRQPSLPRGAALRRRRRLAPLLHVQLPCLAHYGRHRFPEPVQCEAHGRYWVGDAVDILWGCYPAYDRSSVMSPKLWLVVAMHE